MEDVQGLKAQRLRRDNICTERGLAEEGIVPSKEGVVDTADSATEHRLLLLESPDAQVAFELYGEGIEVGRSK